MWSSPKPKGRRSDVVAATKPDSKAPPGPSAGDVVAVRRRYRENAAALLAELEALPELTAEQEQEAAYYRSVVSPLHKRTPARVEAA